MPDLGADCYRTMSNGLLIDIYLLLVEQFLIKLYHFIKLNLYSVIRRMSGAQ